MHFHGRPPHVHPSRKMKVEEFEKILVQRVTNIMRALPIRVIPSLLLSVIVVYGCRKEVVDRPIRSKHVWFVACGESHSGVDLFLFFAYGTGDTPAVPADRISGSSIPEEHVVVSGAIFGNLG